MAESVATKSKKAMPEGLKPAPTPRRSARLAEVEKRKAANVSAIADAKEEARKADIAFQAATRRPRARQVKKTIEKAKPVAKPKKTPDAHKAAPKAKAAAKAKATAKDTAALKVKAAAKGKVPSGVPAPMLPSATEASRTKPPAVPAAAKKEKQPRAAAPVRTATPGTSATAPVLRPPPPSAAACHSVAPPVPQKPPQGNVEPVHFGDDDPLQLPSAASASAEPEPDVANSGPLTLRARVEYSAVPKGQTQPVFGLVTLEAHAAAAASGSEEGRQPMDLVCVLDVSGSMTGSKVEDVKSAVRHIISELKPSDRLSIVTFNDQATRLLRLRQMVKEGRDAATAVTLRLSADGGTSIAAGLRKGLEVVEQRRHRNKVTSILLLTDGQDRSCEPHLKGIVQRASAANCGLYTFGFGQDHDETTLKKISEQALTPYSYIETHDHIFEAFAGLVGGLSSIVAQQIELTLTCAVQLCEVNTAFPVTCSGQKVQIVIPDMFDGSRRDVLVEMLVPANPPMTDEDGNLQLLEASSKYLDIRRGAGVQVRSAPVKMLVQQVDEPQPELEPDTEVADQKERVQVTKALDKATLEADKGNFKHAGDVLEKQKSKTGKRMSVIAQALTKDLEDAQQRISDRASWRLSGKKELEDTSLMHKMQRCTHSEKTESGMMDKCSKEMYFTKRQLAWSDRAKEQKQKMPRI